MKFDLNKNMVKQQQKYQEFNALTYVKILLRRLLMISITTILLLLVSILTVSLCNGIVNVGLILLTSIMLTGCIAYAYIIWKKRKNSRIVNEINAEEYR